MTKTEKALALVYIIYMNKRSLMKHLVNYEVCKSYSSLSTCARLKVGAVLIDEDTNRPLAVGYNGTPAGITNCNELFITENDNHYLSPKLVEYLPDIDRELLDKKMHEDVWREFHHQFSLKYEVHAEMNMVLNAFKQGVDFSTIEHPAVFITHTPCDQCLKNLAALGIKKVYYETKYDRMDTTEYARTLGIELIQKPE